jgi:uncharacterized membrane protein YfcA
MVLAGISFTSGLVYCAAGVGGGVIFQGLYFVFRESWPDLQLGGLRQAVALGCTVIGSQLALTIYMDRRCVVGKIPMLMNPFQLTATFLGTLLLVFAEQATLGLLQRLLGILLMLTSFRMLYSYAVATRKKSLVSLTALYALGGVAEDAELSEVEGLVVGEVGNNRNSRLRKELQCGEAQELQEGNGDQEPNSQPGSPLPLLKKKARTVAQTGKTPSRQNLLEDEEAEDSDPNSNQGRTVEGLAEATRPDLGHQSFAMSVRLKVGTVLTGFCSGFLGSVFGVAGPPLMVYVIQAGLLKRNIRGTVACCIGPSYALSIVIFAASGYLTSDQLPLHSCNIVSSFAGMAFGQVVHTRISQQQLTVGITALLLVISAQLAGGSGNAESAGLSWAAAVVGAGLSYSMGRYLSIHVEVSVSAEVADDSNETVDKVDKQDAKNAPSKESALAMV